ncbi:MAG: hypothetical protein MI924_21930, partial [Chloroflexales bacterium]|nr:hypothetical protein [Chloroflexales bacterium]
GRVIHWAGESWNPVRAPFQGPVYDLAWDDNSLLAITKQGLYRYDRAADSWTREHDAGAGWRFVRLEGRLALVDTDTGAVASRHGAGWQEERMSVPLDIS